MTSRIEDYALIGDMHTAALVGRDGSIDWFCVPRFDSPACFAALLGDEDNGRWLVAPSNEVRGVSRRYRGDTLVLETEFRTDSGTVAVIDFMPPAMDDDRRRIVRLVEGRSGTVPMRCELVFRCEYGRVVPWVRRQEDGLRAVAGPTGLRVHTRVPLEGKDFRTCGRFDVAAGEQVPFVLTFFESHREDPPTVDAQQRLDETETWWRDWIAKCSYEGEWREAVVRSLLTLKALTYDPTGGIVAAPTTSLPEAKSGGRNWDYRFCWLRDATFTLYALLISGFHTEARAWREWLLRSVAGTPSQLQPVYGLAGERRLQEARIPWLAGFAASAPVRTGNAAYEQYQLDVYGEIMDAFHMARAHGIEPDDDTWQLQRALLEFLESKWSEPDAGIWEMRGPPRHFTHSKVMAWVGVDRGIKAVERFGLDGPLDKWRALRERMRDEICRYGFSSERNAFVQYYGGDALDGALLMMPLVGFLPASDPRMMGTVEAIRTGLASDGLVLRYGTDGKTDGLEGSEGAFLACSFWLADNLELMGRREEARRVFDRLLGLRNDLGLLSEEYDTESDALLGNFPQAFSHIALVNTAFNLSGRKGHDRPARGDCD